MVISVPVGAFVIVPINPHLSIGGVNHGVEDAVSAQVVIPTDTMAYSLSLDKSKNQFHTIVGVGKSFGKGYAWTTASYAKENHHNKDLTGYGASVGGVYTTTRTYIDANLTSHKANNAHIDSQISETHSQTVEVAGNIETTTTTHTHTTTTRDFKGDTRNYFDLGATLTVGQN